jgi:UDP-N-acetylmuramoyl-L-alanyl-D-glutamate--2,6-diaminopimelate ligase
MIVEELFSKIPFAEIICRPNANISGVAIDSNMVEPGDLFIPLIGENYNGYRFVNHALQKGASAVAGDEIRSRKNHLACIYLPNAQKHLPFICSTVYRNPSKKLQTIGITGTNGKTTTAHLIEAIIRGAAGNKVGYIGTTGYRWTGLVQDANLTTPFSPQLQRMLRKMTESGVESVVLECSSHGIEQHRLDYTHFDVAVFTNLTLDHLDYHGNFVSYRNAKWKLFSSLLVDSDKRRKYAVFNIDDPTGRSWARESLSLVETITYSIEKKSNATIQLENYTQHENGMDLRIRVQDLELNFRTPMLGLFNIQNILAALSVAHVLRLDMNKAAEVLSKGVYVPGRLEKLVDTANFDVFIDFAHSEDALSRSLDVMNQIKKNRLITVFGCGGDNDKSKRPKMGKIAVEKSDIVIATSDNSRSEDPEKILDEIFSGIDQSDFSKKEIFRITKRSDAIEHALRMAQKDDIVMIAGKGHETFQKIGNFKHPFEDKKIVKAWIKNK